MQAAAMDLGFRSEGLPLLRSASSRFVCTGMVPWLCAFQTCSSTSFVRLSFLFFVWSRAVEDRRPAKTVDPHGNRTVHGGSEEAPLPRPNDRTFAAMATGPMAMDPSDGHAHGGGKEKEATEVEKEPLELQVARKMLHRRMKVRDATLQTTAVPLRNGAKKIGSFGC